MFGRSQSNAKIISSISSIFLPLASLINQFALYLRPEYSNQT